MRASLILMCILMAVSMLGCASSGGGSPEGRGLLSDWDMEPGWNGATIDRLRIEKQQEEDGNNVAKVSWSAGGEWGMARLFATLPRGVDYGEFDGIYFRIRNNNGEDGINLYTAIHGDRGVIWRVDHWVNRSNDQPDGWAVVFMPFYETSEPDWGVPCRQNTLKEWLTIDKYSTRTLHISPVLNPSVMQIGADQVTLFDDIGFFKGSAYDPESITIIWTFDE